MVVGIVGHDSRAGPGSKLVVSNFPMAVALGLVDNRRRKLAEGCRKDQERAALPVGGTVAVVHIQSVEMRKFDQQEAILTYKKHKNVSCHVAKRRCWWYGREHANENESL